MRLIEKAAVVMVVSISSQILCSRCIPRKHSKFPLKSNVKNIKSQNDKTVMNEVSRNKSTDIKDSVAIRFHDVEYPSDSDLGEYYRFLNDYPVQCKSEKYMSNSSCQEQTNKMETKCKRKFYQVANAKDKPQTTNSFTEQDPHPQPDCFSTLSYFPEVEYPLSARDMWIPKYWSRLQDIKRNRNAETDRQIDRIPKKNIVITNNDSDYETLPLNTLLKTINTKKTQVTEMPNKDINVQPPNTDKPGDFLDVTSTRFGALSSEIKSDIPSTTLPRNSSRPIDNISTECLGITIEPESQPSTSIFTPLDYYDSFPSMVPVVGYSDVTEATTAVPFECITSSMSSQATTTAPNLILTTHPLPSISSAPTLPNSYYDYSRIANEIPQNDLDIDQGNLTEKNTLNPNDSYPICQLLPEDSDDWIIYVDTEKTFPSQENETGYKMTGDEDKLFTNVDTLSWCLDEIPEISMVENSTLITTPNTAHGDESNKLQEVTKNLPNNFPVLNITNSVVTLTDTGNIDLSHSLIPSCLNENNDYSCASSVSASTQTENVPSRENSTGTSITVLTVDDTWVLVYDTENTTQSVTENEYEAVYSAIGSTTDEESILKANDTMDQILYFEDSNSTFQFEYVDDASASFTEMPYDLIL